MLRAPATSRWALVTMASGLPSVCGGRYSYRNGLLLLPLLGEGVHGVTLASTENERVVLITNRTRLSICDGDAR